MTFLSDAAIIILAELIKWSSPWYIRQTMFTLIQRGWRYTVFMMTIVMFVVFPSSEEYATYRIPSFAELWGSVLPETVKLPATILEMPLIEEPSAALLSENDFARLFPTPDALKYHVALWKDIFGRYTSRQVVLYDSWYPQLVYEVIDRDSGSANVTARIKAYRSILRSLAHKEKHGGLNSLTPAERRVYKLFDTVTEKNRFSKAAERQMRGQNGQYERFLQALQASGMYQQKFTRIFQEYGVPVELTWLPFVESFYNYKAYSHAGAAGVWQFISSTARLYDLKISSAADERFDPFKSADAAARLLKANHELLHTWPLAVTAYNHGTVGMLRAARQFGSDDFGKIAMNYRSSSFGFYSRNYYAEFVAVAQLMRENQQKFKAIERLPAITFDEVCLEQRMFLRDVAAALSVSPDELGELNRDFKKNVLKSKIPIPKRFRLKVPAGKKEELLAAVGTP